jgi:hypothetical protein
MAYVSFTFLRSTQNAHQDSKSKPEANTEFKMSVAQRDWRFFD